MDRRPKQIVAGEIVEIEETYTREAPVGLTILAPVLAAAGLAKAAGAVVAAALRRNGDGGGRRTFKQLRKGPEIPVTPVWVRDEAGTRTEVEVHGYVSSQALLVRDRVAATVTRQRRRDLPPRAERIENLTSGRTLVPHPPTTFTHLGPALLLQALVGVVLAVLLLACVLGVFR